MKGWPANPELVRHLKSNLIRTCVHVDEAVMGLSVHTDGDGEGENPLLHSCTVYRLQLVAWSGSEVGTQQPAHTHTKERNIHG